MNNSSIFSNKKVLILIPHQDDETNICGGIIKTLVENNCDITIAYSTNGDYSIPVNTRYSEGRRALKKLGIKKPKIILLGYSDQYSEEEKHLYTTYGDNIWTSKNGRNYTYGTKKCDDFRYHVDQYHNKFNHDCFVSDLKMLFVQYLPDIIFTIDFDSHPDHRALSLAVEKAVGMTLKDNKSYKPLLFKAFAYPTAYFGINDFNSINIKSTVFKPEQCSEFSCQNPYYSFSDRIRFPVNKKSRKKILLFNNVYKALKCHKSQIIVKKSFSTINGDQIFWQRRTDNLLLNSNIKVSSGQKQFLNDFLYFDCKDIMNGQTQVPKFTDCYWKPNIKDKDKRIDIFLEKRERFDNIYIYQPCHISDKIKKIELYFDDKYFDLIRFTDTLKTSIKLKTTVEAKKVSIKILEATGEQAGISEIEIYPKREEIVKLIKIMDNDEFIYSNYYKKNGPLNIKIYSYDGTNSKILDDNEYRLYHNNEIVSSEISNSILNGTIKVELKSNKKIVDYVVVKKYKNYNFICNEIINFFNYVLVFINIFIQKIARKIKKILKIYSK